MPCIENWQKQPLTIVQNIFDNRTNDDWPKKVQEYFEARINDSEKLLGIPSLNDCPLHDLQSNSLVRFRCMIQDTYDNEFFLETYDVTDKANGSVTQRTSCYQDVVCCPKNCEVNMDSAKNKTGMRQILYCVSIPGETKWVKEAWKSRFGMKPSTDVAGTSSPSQKRGLDDDDEMGMEAEGSSTDADRSHKRICSPTQESKGKKKQTPPSVNKNHPLADESGPVCLVKVYDESADFKVNEILEFVGILSVDPLLSTTFDSGDGAESAVTGMETDDLEEKRAHHPPASLVPRLHVVTLRRLQHINPLLPPIISNETVLSDIKSDMSRIRSQLIGLLEKATLGDSLAAEYLLLHLLARVYSRRDMMALGKFSLNISGIPAKSSYPRLLSDFLKDLVTKLHYFPMKLDKINSLRFTPMKNYSTNRLDTGMLQLPSGTHLILDEVMMEPGTMDANGVKNIQALKNLLSFQKVEYNFQFHEASFESDVNVLILSEGKSLLPCDCQVQLKPPNGLPQNMEQYFTTFCAECPMEFLNKCRGYIDAMRLLEYELSQDMTKCIEDDFVAARRDEARRVTADDLHSWLVLGRLLSLSVGQSGLSVQRWERVKALETQRRERMAGIPTMHQNDI